MLKRLMDMVVSGLLLVTTWPLMLAISLAVKGTSPGPVLYRGTRVGRNGRPFKMLKFRSMVTNAEKIGGSSSGNDDPRITAVGRLMRKFKLDELPQVWNVFVGDMSLVGPRPQVQHDVDKYTAEERAILRLRPGITDWASIWNSDEGAVLAGAADPDQAYIDWIRPTKLRLQLAYLEHQSVGVDLQILFHTAIRIFHKSWTPRAIRKYPPLVPSGSKQASVSSTTHRKAA